MTEVGGYFDRHPGVLVVLIICALPPVMMLLGILCGVKINVWKERG